MEDKKLLEEIAYQVGLIENIEKINKNINIEALNTEYDAIKLKIKELEKEKKDIKEKIDNYKKLNIKIEMSKRLICKLELEKEKLLKGEEFKTKIPDIIDMLKKFKSLKDAKIPEEKLNDFIMGLKDRNIIAITVLHDETISFNNKRHELAKILKVSPSRGIQVIEETLKHINYISRKYSSNN